MLDESKLFGHLYTGAFKPAVGTLINVNVNKRRKDHLRNVFTRFVVVVVAVVGYIACI